jgi:adenosylhomocysteine nucleosidase
LSKLGIIAALPAEAKCLHNKKLNVATPVEIHKDIFLCLSGIGYESAYKAANKLLALKVDALISWGVAGAIDDSLNPGDMILAESIISPDRSYKISNEWINNISNYFKQNSYDILSGDIVSSKEMCASTSDKKLLLQETAALAVDMESAAIAEAATINNLDFLAIRAIADNANTNIPEAVVKHTDNVGQPKLFSFISSCMLNPVQVRDIFILAKSYQSGLRTLTKIGPDLKDKHFFYSG